jgi:hypothetical protein
MRLKEEDPCWDDYEMVGMKKKNGKEVPNCVPKSEATDAEEQEFHSKLDKLVHKTFGKRPEEEMHEELRPDEVEFIIKKLGNSMPNHTDYDYDKGPTVKQVLKALKKYHSDFFRHSTTKQKKEIVKGIQKYTTESIDEGMVSPRRGHNYYQLTKDTPIKYVSGHSGIGLEVPGVLLHNEYDTIKGKKGAYIIDYFGQHFYVDLKNKFASRIAHPENREQNKDLMKNVKSVDVAPEHSDWKKYVRESIDEDIKGMSKQELDRAARGMFGKSYSRLTMDQAARLKYYLSQSKNEAVKIKMNNLDWGKSTAERNANLDKYDLLKTDKEREAFLRKLKGESVNEGKSVLDLKKVQKEITKKCKDVDGVKITKGNKLTGIKEIEIKSDWITSLKVKSDGNIYTDDSLSTVGGFVKSESELYKFVNSIIQQEIDYHKKTTKESVTEQADHVSPMVVKAYKEYLQAKKEGYGEKAYRYYSKKLNNTYSTRADRDAIEAILKKKYGSAMEESVNEASVSDFEIGDFVHFKSKNKTGMVVSVKGNKVTINTPKGKITSDVKDVKVLHQDNVNEVASRTAMEIGGLTGMNKDAIQKFVDDNKLDIEKVYQFVKKGKLADRMKLVSAIAGKPNNPVQKKMVKQFGEGLIKEAKVRLGNDSVNFKVLGDSKGLTFIAATGNDLDGLQDAIENDVDVKDELRKTLEKQLKIPVEVDRGYEGAGFRFNIDFYSLAKKVK